MSLIRFVIFFIFIYLVIRLVLRMFSLLRGNISNQVKGRPRNSAQFKNRKNIEDADYEDLK